jgi:hypothetical protein
VLLKCDTQVGYNRINIEFNTANSMTYCALWRMQAADKRTRVHKTSGKTFWAPKAGASPRAKDGPSQFPPSLPKIDNPLISMGFSLSNFQLNSLCHTRCHTMRKLSVPYTIRRNGVYYLNIRLNNQFVRQALATKDPMEAFQKVNQIAPLLSNADVCEQMLRLQMSDIVGKSSRSRACGLKLAQSDDSLLLLSQGFALYKKEQIIENWGIRTAAQNESTFKQLLELIGSHS